MKNLTIAFLAAASLFTVGACKKKGDVVAKMTEFKNAMCACKDEACVKKVQADMEAFGKTAGEPDKATQEKLGPLVMEMMTCAEKAVTPAAGSAAAPTEGSAAAPAAGSADGSAAPAAAAGDLPAECNDYKAEIEALAKCDKLPQPTKDALKQSYEQTSAAWASVPAEGKAALATSCKAATDAVKQSAAACN